MDVANNFDKQDVIDRLSAELIKVRKMDEYVVHQTTELQIQVAARKNMQGYVRAAMQESQKIAEEITSKAQKRVDTILLRAENIVGKQQEQIACLNKEIAELKGELCQEPNAAEDYYPQIKDMLSKPREYSLREPPAEFLAENMPDALVDEPKELNQQLLQREYSLREPQAEFLAEDVPDTLMDEPPESGQQLLSREYSLREPPAEFLAENMPDALADEPMESDQQLLPREYSLREPPADFLAEYVPDILKEELPESDLEKAKPILEDEPEESVPPLAADSIYADDEALEIEGLSEPISAIDEQMETVLRIDTTVEASHYHSAEGGPKSVHSHCWSVDLEVEVPEYSREFVGYGKVYSAVINTLSKFDGKVLNDAYPFNLFEPSPNNIADYFYNCLEDSLILIDVILKEMVILEDQQLIKEVHARNEELDEMLQGEDILQEMRENLFSRDKEDPGSERAGSLKGRLGQLFKR